MKNITHKIIWLTLFSMAMGLMETAVVVYLRKIYYPDGFRFPLIRIDADIALIEFLREVATIIMLLGIGILTGKTASQKFAFFIYCFAIWDIFYYIFLKVLLDWPESLFTWDILFLIPVPWVGPVIAPCIVSATMIVLTLYIVYFQEKGCNTKISFREWALLVSGSLIIILSFMWDYFKYISHENAATQIWTLSSKESMFNEIVNYIPTDYNWWLFSIGHVLISLSILIFVKRMREKIT
ncbi:MAG TPA: hypothetical protein VFL70_04030 [Bacteroidia bacterium]|nr:hypothetical protein [Bacteroidia bacterium]